MKSSLDARSDAILVSHRVGLSTALPYARAISDLGRQARLYCLGDFVDLARELAPDGVAVVDSAAFRLPGRSNALKKLTWALSDFDPGGNADQRQSFDHHQSISARLRQGASWLTRRLSPEQVNRLMSVVGGIGCRPLLEERLWIVSFLTEPSLAIGRNRHVVTLIDSWDHPVRRTAGYRTEVVVGWNGDLAHDWAIIQGAERTVCGAPLKLQYAADAYPIQPAGERRFMFAVGTSSHTPAWQAAELRLAELVCEAAAEAGWSVMLKLKPTGGQEEWLEFDDRWSNVEIAGERESLGPMDYFLDDAYNAERLEQLAKVEFVLNTVTTFGLDAACAGVPVLQLADLTGPGLSGLQSAQRNYHIQKYLLRDRPHLFNFTEAEGSRDLASWLTEPDARAHEYSSALRQWLVPDCGFDVAVKKAVEAVIYG